MEYVERVPLRWLRAAAAMETRLEAEDQLRAYSAAAFGMADERGRKALQAPYLAALSPTLGAPEYDERGRLILRDSHALRHWLKEAAGVVA